jgi:hypothetical protein
MRARTLPIALTLLLLGTTACTPDGPTELELRTPGAPSFDGTGYFGGGGRASSADDSTSATAGTGYFGGGGRISDTTTAK